VTDNENEHIHGDEEAVSPPALVEPPAPVAETASEVGPVESVEPVVAAATTETADVAPVVAAAAAQQVVYVAAPVPPKLKGNRWFGVLIAVLATALFAAVYALFGVILLALRGGQVSLGFVGQTSFLVPVGFFAIGFILLVIVANRANWWAYILGSIFVGVFVYFGTIGSLLLIGGITSRTPAEAGVIFAAALQAPTIIAAGLIAREVSIWVGTAVSARGRKVKLRNAQALADFEEENERARVEREHTGYVTPPGV
jgi:hypothetical protein